MDASVNRFERMVGDRVTTAGGRVVKLIGDEAMFAFGDLHDACITALELIDESPSPVRVGLAFGDVVAMHGDYFGPTVNLAARLVSVAKPSILVASTEARDILQDRFRFDAMSTGPLRGCRPTDEDQVQQDRVGTAQFAGDDQHRTQRRRAK